MAITNTGGVDRMLQSLGLNPAFADQLQQAMSVNKRDPAQVGQLLYTMYASLNLPTNFNDNGGAIPPRGFVPRPVDYAMLAIGGPNALPPIGNGFGGMNAEGALGNSQLGYSLQVAMLRSPEFRQSLEKALGGILLPSGNQAGALDVWKPQQQRVGVQMRQAQQQGYIGGSFVATFSSMSIPMQGNPMAAGGPTGSILRGLQAMEANIVSSAKGLTGNPGMESMANQLGINMQNASFEDILFLSMMSYSTKKEKEISGKVNELAGGQQAQTAPTDGGFGGLFGLGGGTTAQGLGIQGVQTVNPLAQLFGAGNVQGQGGQVVDGQGNVVGDPNKMSDTMKQQMMQKMMGDLQKMYEMLSNMIKTMHDMQMTPIRNLRG
ncbi:MAG: hypothetical protein HY904_10060 [Deltaproteobacteria bacterium]|nr:hypothetical protein [Deltaproteobacteria bacterium]